jgi:AcrR family transcriptional regulator
MPAKRTNRTTAVGGGPRKPGRPVGGDAGGRGALLSAARAVFAEKGYESASIKEIVERAGVTPPALYHHFGNKVGIYEAAAADVYDIVIAGFENAIAGKTTLRERFTALIDCSVEMNARDPMLARFIVSAPFVVPRHPELRRLAPQLNRTQRFFAQLVVDTDELAVPTADFVNCANSMLWGLTRLAAIVRSPDDYAGAVETLHRLIDNSLFTDPRRQPRLGQRGVRHAG